MKIETVKHDDEPFATIVVTRRELTYLAASVAVASYGTRTDYAQEQGWMEIANVPGMLGQLAKALR